MIEFKEMVPLTELIYSCWVISAEEGSNKDTMATAPGVLDYGLRNAVSEGAFPDWVRKRLHFVSADTGLVCLELPFIQKVATELKLTSEPNPSYTRSEIVIGKPLARRCLSELGIAEEQAKSWGLIFRRKVGEAEEELTAARR